MVIGSVEREDLLAAVRTANRTYRADHKSIWLDLIGGRLHVESRTERVKFLTCVPIENFPTCGEFSYQCDGRILQKAIECVPAHCVVSLTLDSNDQLTPEMDAVSVPVARTIFKDERRSTLDMGRSDTGKFEHGVVHGRLVRRIMAACGHCICRDRWRESMCGVCFKMSDGKITAVTSDGARLAKFTGSCDAGNMISEVTVPPEAMDLLGSILASNIDHRIAINACGEGRSRVGELGVGASNITFPLDTVFPDYTKALPPNYTDRAWISAQGFMATTARAARLVDNKTGVNLEFGNNEMLITVSDSARIDGKSPRFNVKQYCRSEGHASTGINLRFLRDAIGAIAKATWPGVSATIESSGACRCPGYPISVRYEGGGMEIEQVVMPMRL